jgi:hypothetical protein
MIKCNVYVAALQPQRMGNMTEAELKNFERLFRLCVEQDEEEHRTNKQHTLTVSKKGRAAITAAYREIEHLRWKLGQSLKDSRRLYA